jgi:hypothetical protein
MQLVKKLVTESNIPMDEYKHISTGKTMLDESDGNTAKMQKPTDHFRIDTDNYVVFSSDAVEYLLRTLNRTDVSRVFQIGNMVIGDCSVICSANYKPHSSDTLSAALQMDKNKFYEMVRRMVKKNILSYCVCAPTGHVQKIYMLNPYIARKKKALNCELLTIFRDITQDGKEKK